SPFRQEPDPGIFFQGAGHPAVVESLLGDIHAGKPLIKLTGSEGVGKTLVYLLLTRKLPSATYDIISLDHPVGSFEDLLRIICLALNPGTKDNSSPRQFIQEFRQLLQHKKNIQRKVLLIIDEAEKIFLATLERLVKMICDTDVAEVLQILLIGRLELDHNLDQLRIYCSNVDINAGYILEPLDFEETKGYLQYRLHAAGIPGSKHLSVFSDAAVSAIYQTALGNISLTNILAEKGLKNACSAGMFEVEPELIALLQHKKVRDFSVFSRCGDLIMQNKWWAAAAAVLFLLLVLVLLPEEKENTRIPDAAEPVTIEEIVIDMPEVPPLEEKEPLVVDKKATDASPPTVTRKSIESQETLKQWEAVVPAEQIESELLQSIDKVHLPADKSVKEAVPPAVIQENVESPEPVQLQEPAKKVKPPEIEPIIVQADARKKKGSDIPEQIKQEDEPLPVEASDVFQDRLRASSNWLAWAYRGGFTIQLMMLTADDAEQNLKKILVQEEYFSVRDDLYIIKRNSPPAFFVFYGMYNTLEEARQARNYMPAFLRGHNPYALSIKDALKKTEE
ncbi:MAG: AAA family ATPase, partial [Desulfobulbaceae bacterium]|nr:AAA family ATPase [Desulfobulbaceae bacterium]